jgi:hypothetical protein
MSSSRRFASQRTTDDKRPGGAGNGHRLKSFISTCAVVFTDSIADDDRPDCPIASDRSAIGLRGCEAARHQVNGTYRPEVPGDQRATSAERTACHGDTLTSMSEVSQFCSGVSAAIRSTRRRQKTGTLTVATLWSLVSMA